MYWTNVKKAGLVVAGALCVSAFLLAGCGGSGGESSAAKSGVAAAKEKIVVGTPALSPKWTQQSDKGGVEGFDIDMWEEIAKRNHWDLEWKVAEFAALWGMIDNGTIDTIANETTPNPQRLEKYNFTEPYAYESYVFVAQKDGTPKDINWFRGKKICVFASANPRLVLEDMNEKENMGMEIGYLDTSAAVYPSVQNGTYDATFTVRSGALIAINDLKMDLETVDAKYKTLPIQYAFTKTPENDKRIQAINQTLKQMHEDGTIKKFSEKWFGRDISVKPE